MSLYTENYENNYEIKYTDYLLDTYFSVIYEIKEQEKYEKNSLIRIFKSLYINTIKSNRR